MGDRSKQTRQKRIGKTVLTGINGLNETVDNHRKRSFVAHRHDHDVNTRLGDVVSGGTLQNIARYIV